MSPVAGNEQLAFNDNMIMNEWTVNKNKRNIILTFCLNCQPLQEKKDDMTVVVVVDGGMVDAAPAGGIASLLLRLAGWFN